jgi:hypothetical protein
LLAIPLALFALFPCSHSPARSSKRDAATRLVRHTTTHTQDAFAERIQARLSQRYLLSFKDFPFKNFVEQLSADTDIAFVIDETALKVVDFDLDELLTIQLSELELRNALRVILKPRALEYSIGKDAIVFSTPKLGQCSRTFNVSLLLESNISPDEIASVIQQTVNPEAWTSLGGISSIEANHDNLVVNATASIHDAIAQLLQTVEAVNDSVRSDSELAEQRLDSKLDGTCDILFDGSRLKDVIVALAELLNAPIVVDPYDLNLINANPDDVIELDKAQSSVRETLTQILDPIRMDYAIQNEVILVSAMRDSGDVRVYDASVFLESDLPMEQLIGTIESKVKPDSWASSGGTGSVFKLGKALVIQNSGATHAAIGKLMRSIDQAAPR